MIIDCHGHYTTAPKELQTYRDAQIAGLKDPSKTPTEGKLNISDDQIRESLEGAQLKFQRERGTDVTIFSPRASAMAHHIGDVTTSLNWTRHCNDLIHRVCSLYPSNFVGVCQLPQSPGVPPSNSIGELERCVNEFGFIGCNLNPDPSGGHWTAPPLTDRYWYPFYEKMVELDVPAMVHVSSSCNPCFHGTGSHYINADTTAFMQFLTADLFKDFPTIRFIIPHGGGAVPFHWGRYRGLAQDMKRPLLPDLMRNNIFFDTCVYHLPGIELLLKVVPLDNILFGSEMVGAVRGIDPETGHYYDDTKRYLDALPLSEEQRYKLFEGNTRRVYPRIAAKLPAALGDLKHQQRGSREESRERLILLIFPVQRPLEMFRNILSGRAGQQPGDSARVVGVRGKQRSQVLLFEFHHRQIDQQKYGRKQHSELPPSRGDH